jgi:hypothetical protein
MRHIFAAICHVCKAKPKQSLFLAIIGAVFLFLPSYSFVETKEIVAEGTYNMGDGETPTVAEGRAISDFQNACDMGLENGCKGLQMVLKKR